ncbi:methyltransferase domain-containing protein [Nonomuraea solani]|uniref:methyltransferase domain-containing protein n=1 Tax=Nonomuraea solani TaxID=1144553 RepID=UPI001F2BEC2D|nr:methyltransferase domain-containing protein [Nonomuraea solani]
MPRWWITPEGEPWGVWQVRDGAANRDEWARAVYQNVSLVTEVERVHADLGADGTVLTGSPTSTSAMPGLVLRLLRHAQIHDGARVLIVGTGSGYPAALAARRFGAEQVTSIDISPYLTDAAAGRLATIGLRPTLLTGDGTGPLPGPYDRIVSMTGVRPIPASRLAALRPGARLVTTIAATPLIVCAVKNADGRAYGQIAWDRGIFTTADTPDQDRREPVPAVADDSGGEESLSRYPVVRIRPFSDVGVMLEFAVPGIRHEYEEHAGGRRTVRMSHPDGSWARATACGDEPSPVVQGGPRRLWDLWEEVRHDWLLGGSMPAYGAQAVVEADGAVQLSRGPWRYLIRWPTSDRRAVRYVGPRAVRAQGCGEASSFGTPPPVRR